jgi:hypothetical protein
MRYGVAMYVHDVLGEVAEYDGMMRSMAVVDTTEF